MKFSIISWIFGLGLVHVSLALKSPQPIFQPPTYRPRGSHVKASLSTFEAFVKRYMDVNDGIPTIATYPISALRLVTFNIHYFRDMYGKRKNVRQIIDDIKAMDPHLTILQEASSGKERKKLEEKLESLGYKYRYSCRANDPLVNMIVSKVPFDYTRDFKLGKSGVRCVAEVGITFDGKMITVLGTHLEVKSGQERLEQMQQITSHIKSSVRNQNYIIGADFNEDIDSPGVQWGIKGGYFIESFHAKGWTLPNYTCWAGTTIDFILVSPSLREAIYAAYVRQSLTSDHLPVITDIDISKVVNVSRQATAQASSSSTGSLGNFAPTALSYSSISLVIAISLAFLAAVAYL